MDEFIDAVTARWPSAIVQVELELELERELELGLGLGLELELGRCARSWLKPPFLPANLVM